MSNAEKFQARDVEGPRQRLGRPGSLSGWHHPPSYGMWLPSVWVQSSSCRVNLVASVSSWKNVKTDLSEDRLFTISDGTREVLRNIDEPITARLYFSRRLAELAPEQSRYFPAREGAV